MPESLSQLFVEHYTAHRDERAFRQRRGYRMESFTYGAVLNMANRFATELDVRGIAKGDRIMIWAENSAEWVAAFIGCALRAVVVVPMDDGAALDFTDRVFRQVNAKLMVASRDHAQEFGAVASPDCCGFIDELVRRQESHPSTPPVAVERDDILQIVFTSGTTAEPRGVVITHGNVLSNIAPIEQQMRGYLRYERYVHPLRFLSLLPLSHVFGQFLGMYLPPLLGGTVVFSPELKPSEIVSTIRRERVSVLVSVPRVLQSLKQKIERDLEQQSETERFRKTFKSAEGRRLLRRWWIFRCVHREFGWKFWAMISGGAALDRETEEFWGRLGYAVIQGYGLTETTSLISLNHPFRLEKGSIGKVLPGRELKLAEDGEILVRGGGVASSYWDKSGTHGVADAEGWYHTGDIGGLDDAGNLYFKGRKKDVIVTPGGTKVYPDDLEAALRRQPEVKDCVVVGVERGGNAEACAVLILRGDASAQQAVAGANDSLADYQRIRSWVQWPEDDFPRTSTQKPRRNLIGDFVRAKLLDQPAGPDASPLTQLVSRIAGRPLHALDENSSLEADLGLSSLDRVELLSALEDRYQVDLIETRFTALKTVGDLERMLSGQDAAPAVYHYPAWALHWPVTWMRFLAHYLLMRPAILLLGWPRIIGRENLRNVQGPLLVIANHIGDVDPGFILTALPARFRNRLAIAAGGEALELLRTPAPERHLLARMYDRVQWALGVSLLNLFPLPRAAGFRRSFAYAGHAVDLGYNVLVFPEGRHTTDGHMNPFRSGIGLLAENLGIPVLPMRIDGLYEVKKSGKKFAPPWKITVRIGKPVKLPPGTDAAEIAADLQRRVQEL